MSESRIGGHKTGDRDIVIENKTGRTLLLEYVSDDAMEIRLRLSVEGRDELLEAENAALKEELKTAYFDSFQPVRWMRP